MGKIGEIVRKARLDAGMTARELARALRLSHSYISQLESGGIVSPSPGVLKRLSEAVQSLDYRKLLVLAGYISRVDELGGEPGISSVFDDSDSDSNCNSDSVELKPVADREAAARLIDAVTGRRRARPNGRRVPLLGAIPAGGGPVVVKSMNDALDSVDMPEDLKGVGPFVALKVHGESMTGAGLMDGDIVIIDRGAAAREADICAIRLEGDNPTLKRAHFKGDTVVLAPANPAFSPLIVNADELGQRVEIIGRVVYSSREY